MPPIPTMLDAEALSLIESIERHHNDLSTFQIPRLRACTGPLPTQQAWAAEVREDIEGLARQIEELDVLVDDHRTEKARRELRKRAEVFRDSLVNLRKDSRAALLASKHAIDSQSRSRREELLRSPAIWQKSTSSSSEKVTEDVLMKANHDVTEALQRTIGLMQKELERSVLSSQLLGKFLAVPFFSNTYCPFHTESSTATIQSASTTHDKLDLILGTSKQLITALEKTDWLDRILIIAGLVFFGLVVLFILKQRIIDRGLRIAFFWTRLLPSSTSSTRSVVQKAGEVVTSVSAATTTVSAILVSSIGGQIEPSIDILESPSFTISATESWTTGQHSSSGDAHVEL
ncbi:Sec20-domain-containing protein [Suillus fuscotomentosus]|uniref:Sec20-domain-containing protein n=1 Tax=Suillus fuscotomentosus TaxID=1912939 RepID=A0AAD4E3K2_9AGAM|nr:Sec20-domain-containing protein [Suillus fuscotomentosus]KAG1898636.1 Sec20-domain-containing protein [Suillus fuscotomentosus]